MLRIIDKNTGLFIRDDFVFDNNTEIGLDVEPAQGFYHPKWDFEKEEWTEGGEKPAPKPKEPTIEERLEALELLELERMFTND